jgi:hypothetical protein
MAALGQFTSAFTCTGSNLGLSPEARGENRGLFQSAPFWARQLRPLFILQHRLRRWLGGMYRQAPFAYEVFTQTSPGRRQRYEVSRPAFRPPT